MWPDLAIYWTLDNFFKSLATIDLPKSPTFLDNFCKGLKIYQYSSEIILGNFLDIWRFFSGHTVAKGLWLEDDDDQILTFKFSVISIVLNDVFEVADDGLKQVGYVLRDCTV